MKIIYKAFAYVCGMIIIIVSLNILTPNLYASQRDDISAIVDNPRYFHSFSFGRSHAGSLDYEYYHKKGHNFALGGRDLASIDYLLRFLVPECDSLEEVLLFVSYTSLYFDNTAMSAGNLNDARKALYYSVPSFMPIDIQDLNNLIFGKFLMFIQADHGWKFIKGDAGKLAASAKDNKLLTVDEIAVSGETQSRRDVLDKRNALNYNPNIVQDNSDKLRQIVEYCKNNHVSVYLIQAPYFHTYTEKVPKEIISEVDSIVKSISLEYNVPYYDFSNDNRFANDITLFANSDHLNLNGKIKFTEILNNTIK